MLKLLKKKKIRPKNDKDPNIKDLEKVMTQTIGINVIIKNDRQNKGSITFLYKDIHQLEKIVEIIKKNY